MLGFLSNRSIHRCKSISRQRNRWCVFFQTNDATGEIFPERWLLDWNDEKENVFIWEYFTDLPAVIDYLKVNGVIEKDIQPTMEAIVAVLDQIQEERPNDISFMLEEFVEVVD